MGDSMIAFQDSGTGYWKCTKTTLKKVEILRPFTVKVFYGKRPFKKGFRKSIEYVKFYIRRRKKTFPSLQPK